MVITQNLLFLSFIAICLCVPRNGKSTIKRADIVFKYSEKCPIHTEWNYTIKTSKISRNKAQISFTMLTTEPLDDRVKADLMVSIWTNGGWKPNYFHFLIPGVCTTLKNKLKKLMQQLAANSNFTVGCPIRKGPLRLDNFLVDMKDYGEYPVLPRSKLRVTTTLLKGNVKLVCTHSYLDIEQSV